MRAFFSTIYFHWKNLFARQVIQFSLFFQPLVYVLVSYLIFKYRGSGNLLPHIMLGAGFTGLWGTVVFSSASDIERERWMGTLELLFTSPTAFRTILLGKITSNTLAGLLTLGLSYIYLWIISGEAVTLTDLPLLVLSLVMTLVSFISLSIPLAYVMSISRQAGTIANFLEYPIFLLCGFFIPITQFPPAVRFLGSLFLPTWNIELFRAAFGVNTFPLGTIIRYCLALTLLSILAGIFFHNHMQRLVRQSGVLSLH